MERGSSTYERTREEALYWKSFSPVFKVDLLGDFRSSLEIPAYFSDNVKGRLPRKVALKGPSTDIDAWEVLVATTSSTNWFIGEGWTNFVTAFSLEENDTLMFKYKNNSYFKVKVISGKTSCEKESSHFVTVSVPQAAVKEEIVEEKSDDLSSKDRLGSVPILLPYDYELKPAETTESSGSPYAESRKRNAETFASPENIRVKTEYEASPHLSNRILFAEQIESARQRAKLKQNFLDNSFFVSLSRSHVAGLMKLGVPRPWWESVIKAKMSQTVRLSCQSDGECRSYVCFCVYDESKNTATITSGWKKFVVDNALCEHDCCVFKLAKPWKDNEAIYLEVEIIRAIE